MVRVRVGGLFWRCWEVLLKKVSELRGWLSGCEAQTASHVETEEVMEKMWMEVMKGGWRRYMRRWREKENVRLEEIGGEDGEYEVEEMKVVDDGGEVGRMW